VSVIGITWWWLLEPGYGLLNNSLRGLGASPPPWLTTPGWAMFGVVIATVWWTAGYNLVLFLAGLQAIPATVYEAARIDGANAWREFRYITLPLLRPTMLLVVVIQVIASFQVFGQVFVMTTGGPGDTTRTVIQYVYESAFVNRRMAEGSAAAWILFVIILVFSWIQFRVLRGHTEY
jgi:multiple sugar transport system permease protein